MGRFGIEFSEDNNTAFTLDKKRHYATKTEGRRRWFEDDVEGGPFQRTLAWASYFVLVFTSLCVFSAPSRAAEAVEFPANYSLIISANSLVLDESAKWNLRGTVLKD